MWIPIGGSWWARAVADPRQQSSPVAPEPFRRPYDVAMNPTDGDPGSGSFGGLFDSAGAFGILVLVMMAIIAVVFVLLVVRGVVFPGLKYVTGHDEQVQGRLLARRSNVWGGTGESSARTTYYVTFELANGERREFRVRDRDFGLMVEGDEGTVTFRGDILQRFERVRSMPTADRQALQQDAAPALPPEVRPSSERPADDRRPGDAWGN